MDNNQFIDNVFKDIVTAAGNTNNLITEAMNSKSDLELKSVFIGISHQVGYLTSSLRYYATLKGIDKEDIGKIGF